MAAPFANAAPGSKLVFEKSSFVNPKSRHEAVLNSKFFSHKATIVLPFGDTSSRLAFQIKDIQDQQKTHLVSDVPLHHLVDKEFIEAFVKRGQIYMLSHRTHIDTHNCVALLPTGHLLLHVTKDTYEQLGIEGKPSVYSYRKPTKYVIDIDLKPDSFTPGRKGYDRVLWCLKDRLNLTFDLLLSWSSHDGKICPSSAATFFEGRGLAVQPVPWRVETQWLNKVQVPALDSNVAMATEESCGREETLEWLGAMACGVDLSESAADSFVSTLSCPLPSVTRARCLVLSVSGFLTPASTRWLLQKLRSEVESKKIIKIEDQAGWGSVTFHGFQDAPISSASREHGFYQEGDNWLSFLAFPNKDWWLFSASGHHDLCQ